MKKLGVLMFALMIGTSSVVVGQQKQQKQDRMQKGQQMVEQAKTDLNLSKEQATEWDSIHEKFFSQMKALKGDESLSDEAKKAKSREIRDSKDQSLKAMLTEEQYKQFIELRNQERKQYQKKNQNGIDARPNRSKASSRKQVMADLNLSSEQELKWNEISKRYKQQVQEIKQDDSISEDVKNEKVKTLRGEMQSEHMAILNSEQQAVYSKNKAEMKKKSQQKGNGGLQKSK